MQEYGPDTDTDTRYLAKYGPDTVPMLVFQYRYIRCILITGTPTFSNEIVGARLYIEPTLWM